MPGLAPCCAPAPSPLSSPDVLIIPVTLMLTTAAPLRAAIWEKSGKATTGAVAAELALGAVETAACACEKLKAPTPAAPRTPTETSASTNRRGEEREEFMRGPFKSLSKTTT